MYTHTHIKVLYTPTLAFPKTHENAVENQGASAGVGSETGVFFVVSKPRSVSSPLLTSTNPRLTSLVVKSKVVVDLRPQSASVWRCWGLGLQVALERAGRQTGLGSQLRDSGSRRGRLQALGEQQLEPLSSWNRKFFITEP